MHLRSSAIYQTPDEKVVILNRFRVKTVKLYSVPLQKVLCAADGHEKQPDEQPTLFHVLRMQKRCSARVIQHFQDEEGQTHNSPLAIMRIFMTHFRKKYDIIEVDDGCINTMTETVYQHPGMPYMEHLNQPIDIDEIRQAVLPGNGKMPREVIGWAVTFTKLTGQQ